MRTLVALVACTALVLSGCTRTGPDAYFDDDGRLLQSAVATICDNRYPPDQLSSGELIAPNGGYLLEGHKEVRISPDEGLHAAGAEPDGFAQQRPLHLGVQGQTPDKKIPSPGDALFRKSFRSAWWWENLVTYVPQPGVEIVFITGDSASLVGRRLEVRTATETVLYLERK